jgi:outer membrane protein assembly factor BamB
VEFDQPKYKIGTAPDNDLVLEHEEVQARQAEIDSADGAFSIVDVSENKSTTVNGKKIERVNLNYGDRIAFGPVVALFYPSKKEAAGAKTKLLLFVAAGGIVLVLSVGLVFYLASRRISTDLTAEIGGALIQKQEDRPAPRRERVRRERPRRTPAGAEGETLEEDAGEAPRDEAPPEEEASGGEAGAREAVALELPEPTIDEIRKRDAVAIPRGIRRYFFRKKEIRVAVPASAAEGAVSGQGEAAGSEVGAEAGGVSPVSVPAGQELAPADEEGGLPAGVEAAAEGETAPAGEKGFFARVLSPVTRLFGGGGTEAVPGEEALEEELAGELAAAEEGPPEGSAAGVEEIPGEGESAAAGESGTAPGGGPGQNAAPGGTTGDLESDIARAVEPLSALRTLDIPVLNANGFEEKPVYSRSEIQDFRAKNLPGEAGLSRLEDRNATVVWENTAGEGTGSEEGGTVSGKPGRGGDVTRTGAAGRLGAGRGRELVYGTHGGVLIGLAGLDGKELFALNAGSELGGAFFEPLLADLNRDGRDDIVLAFDGGNVACFDANAKRSWKIQRMWLYEGKERITVTPALIDVSGDGVRDVVLATLGMDLVAVDGKSGFELWRFYDATGETLGPPVGLRINEDGTDDVVFATVDGFLHGVDGKTGWGLWKASIPGRPAGGPAVGPIGEGREAAAVTLTRNGALSAHDRGGKPLFTHEMKSSFIAGPSLGDADGDGNVDIATIDLQGTVRVVEGLTRIEKWRFQSEAGTTMGRLALADLNGDGGMDVLFSTLSGVLTVLDGRSGDVLARRNIGDNSFVTPIVADLNGDKKLEIVTAGRGGRVGAVQVASAGVKLITLKKSGWGSVNQNGMNTGYSKFSYRYRGN